MRKQKDNPPARRVIGLLLVGGLVLMHTTSLRAKAPPAFCRAPACRNQNTAVAGGPQDTKQIRFKNLLTGQIKGEDKALLAITDYDSSDGVGVTVIHGVFPSPVLAQEYLEKVVAKALKVNERGEKKDQQGKIVGKRATAIVPTGEPNKPINAILLTYGRDFYEIQCDSPRHAREMEIRLTSTN